MRQAQGDTPGARTVPREDASRTRETPARRTAATPPIITAAALKENGSTTRFGDTAGAADSFTLTFNETMKTNTTGIQISVLDSDPGSQKTLATFDCSVATNSSCVWTTSGTMLTVTVGTLGPTVNVAGTNAGTCVAGSSVSTCTNALFLPLTITSTTGLTDEDDGVAVNLSGSTKTIQ